MYLHCATVRVGDAADVLHRLSSPEPAGPWTLYLLPRSVLRLRGSEGTAVVGDPTMVLVRTPSGVTSRPAAEVTSLPPGIAEAVAVARHAPTGIGTLEAPRTEGHGSAWHATGVPTAHFLRLRRGLLALRRRTLAQPHAEALAQALVRGIERLAPGTTGTRHRVARLTPAGHALAEAARLAVASTPQANDGVPELARRLGTSPSHLCRVFRALTDQTLHQYRLELRLRLAWLQLETAPAEMSRLAHDLGFSSHSHFSAHWRRRYGLTPSMARRLLHAPTPELSTSIDNLHGAPRHAPWLSCAANTYQPEDAACHSVV